MVRSTTRFSRRRLCGGALVLLGVTGVGLVGGCSGDDPAGEAGSDGASPDGEGGVAGAPGGAVPGEVDASGAGEEGGSAAGDAGAAGGSEGGPPVMYASPTCGCCREYADYLRDNGHSVEVRLVDDLPDIKDSLGVPTEAESCHTTMIGGYIVEGHVPVEVIDKLLRERPGIDGVALPDMPAGSPGMGGTKEGPFEILSINGGTVTTYMTV